MLLQILLGLAAIFFVAALAARRQWAQLFGVALALPVAFLTYGVLGIAIARMIGVGRFYSVPFGAEHVEDWHILTSVAFWTCAWAIVILLFLGRRHREA